MARGAKEFASSFMCTVLKNSRFYSLVLVDLAVIVAEEGQVESVRRELHAAPPALQLRHIFVCPIGNPIEDHPR